MALAELGKPLNSDLDWTFDSDFLDWMFDSDTSVARGVVFCDSTAPGPATQRLPPKSNSSSRATTVPKSSHMPDEGEEVDWSGSQESDEMDCDTPEWPTTPVALRRPASSVLGSPASKRARFTSLSLFEQRLFDLN